MSTLEGWDIGDAVMAGLGLGSETQVGEWAKQPDAEVGVDEQEKHGTYMAIDGRSGEKHRGILLLTRCRAQRTATLIPGCATAQVTLTQQVGGPTSIEAKVDDSNLSHRKAVSCLTCGLVTALAMQQQWDKEGYDGKYEKDGE